MLLGGSESTDFWFYIGGFGEVSRSGTMGEAALKAGLPSPRAAQPDLAARDHRPKVAVIGGGVAGCAAANVLQRNNVKCFLFEVRIAPLKCCLRFPFRISQRHPVTHDSPPPPPSPLPSPDCRHAARIDSRRQAVGRQNKVFHVFWRFSAHVYSQISQLHPASAANGPAPRALLPVLEITFVFLKPCLPCITWSCRCKRVFSCAGRRACQC